jgi:hypothetical protein
MGDDPIWEEHLGLLGAVTPEVRRCGRALQRLGRAVRALSAERLDPLYD